MQQQGFDIHKLQQEVRTRWLRPKEVLQILQNYYEWFTITHKPAHKPPSGSWFLYNRRVLRFYRNDGYRWQKKKNRKASNESHERLKIDNVEALSCYYARRDENPTFQRRIYWMLDPAYDHIVLVHYRDVLEGSISVAAQNDLSTSIPNGSASRAEVHSSTGWTSELTAPCPNSYSPGSGGEFTSRTVTINNETNNTSPSDRIQEKAALRKLKMLLSLEDKEECYINTEEVPSNKEPIIVHEIQNGELEDCTNLDDIFNVLEFSEEHTKEAGTHPSLSAINVLHNSDTWLEDDQLEAILHSNSMTVTENQWFHIDDVCPEWGFCSENTKVIILGNFLCNPSNLCAVMFGDVKVPVETVQQGVLRCHTPCLDAGKVRLYMIDVNGKPCSEEREFEFLERPTKSMIDGNGEPYIEEQDLKFHQKPTRSSDELLLLLNYVQMLFDGHGCEQFSELRQQLANPDCAFQVNQMKETYEQLDHESTVNHVMEVLLNEKFEQWLSSKVEKSSDGDHLLSKQYHTVIHTIAALGYEWALKPLLSSGVPVNYRDANGWTALHWAARFGREEMVAALLAAGVAAGALSHPTSEDPAAKTAASIASANGFNGISAFLSEAQLLTHLESLESQEKANCNDGAAGGILSAVEGIWDKCTHVHGGSDDQLALKDSLGAIRNAVQAAGCIQAAFRVSSFRKKQEMARQNRNSCSLSIHETVAVSHSIPEKAALSIQKNFRCWKKRKEFLRMRKNVIKIQARVRAHQEKNKYMELLLSVSILEKVMLRWYKKGVGLRGFNSRAMPIDEEVGEDVVKVFRKQRVETAINEAVSRVSAIIDSPIARQQYRRMLEMYQQAKDD